MSRVIRNPRARELQGQRAGIVSRSLAFAADVGVAFLLYTVLVAVIGYVWDLFFSGRVNIPIPPAWFSGLAIFWILVIYLAFGWGSTGRTIGKQLMGLRVVRVDGGSLAPGKAFVRAFLCAIFYPGIALVLLDRRNRSLQDVVVKTVVVYDWIPEAARPRVFPRGYKARVPPAPVTPGSPGASGEQPA